MTGVRSAWLVTMAALLFTGRVLSGPASAAAPTDRITFTKEIAPLVFDRCAMCHHPGGTAPFSLLTYADVKQHATQIAVVTRNRFMPPWKAEPASGPFIGQHPLTDGEIDVIARWVAA